MSIGAMVYTAVHGITGVSNVVSTRIYPIEAPQDASLPYVIYRRVSDVPDYAGNTEGLRSARIQVDCWAATYGAAQTLGDAARAGLSAYQAASGPRVAGCYIDNAVDITDTRDGKTIHALSIDAMFMFAE